MTNLRGRYNPAHHRLHAEMRVWLSTNYFPRDTQTPELVDSIKDRILQGEHNIPGVRWEVYKGTKESNMVDKNNLVKKGDYSFLADEELPVGISKSKPRKADPL